MRSKSPNSSPYLWESIARHFQTIQHGGVEMRGDVWLGFKTQAQITHLLLEAMVICDNGMPVCKELVHALNWSLGRSKTWASEHT
jgi:hypothetical protein